MSAAIDDILAERRRQIEVEGYTSGHDDAFTDNSLARAAACYAIGSRLGRRVINAPGSVKFLWPWGHEWWKPKDRRRNLVRAAALIIAEIERLDRCNNCSECQAMPGTPHASWCSGATTDETLATMIEDKCSQCGLPADTVACGKGGCPLGGDL
jgi:hypothetical protein